MCLFLLMADDERYGGVKDTLNDNYLLSKQEYPSDMKGAKRLLADFKGLGPGNKKRGTVVEGQGIAFTKKAGGKWVPTCHGCGKKCEGGYRACQNITEAH